MYLTPLIIINGLAAEHIDSSAPRRFIVLCENAVIETKDESP